MSQVKIYGLRSHLDPIKTRLSDTLHDCVCQALCFPRDKRAHRFFPLAAEDFYMPDGRSEAYTIVEIEMIAGRSVEATKRLIRMIFERFEADLGIAPVDVEVCIQEAPAHNWGFRGMLGDEIQLNYKIEV